MIDASTIPAHKLRLTTRLICEQAVTRGWKAWLYYKESSQLRLQRPDGTVIEAFSSASPTTSFIAGIRAEDKFYTNHALEEVGLPILETFLTYTVEEASTEARKIIESGRQVVVKPLDASHGNGVTVELSSVQEVAAAFAHAQEYSEAVIVQECVVKPVDIRITCINYKAVASLVRVPARVKGDGVHTILELIDIENNAPRRGSNYTRELNFINKIRAEAYLGDVINDVPSKDEWHQVLGTANVGSGGETIDITDELPEWLKQMAAQAAKTMQLPLCGVDFLLTTMPKITHTLADLNAKVVEINAVPSLFIHETPTFGLPRPVTAAFLDYLETL